MWRLILCLCLCLVSFPVVAAEEDKPLLLELGSSTSYFNEPHYKQAVRDVLSHKMQEDYNFNDLRRFYTLSRHYDPMGDYTQDRLDEITYRVINYKDKDIVEKALEDFDTLIKAHMGNINIMISAIALSKQDSRFGNPVFYQWITQGLIKVAKRQGSGKSFDDPYVIVSSREEELLLKALHVYPIKSELIPYGSAFFNIHTVYDPKQGKEPIEIFVDVSLPINRAKLIYAEKSHKLDLRP